MNLTTATDERDGVTLVELEVQNPTRTTRRVRIENELRGAVLPPRRHGSIVEGFDEDGVTLTIGAGAHRAVGYACRADAESPPATLVGSEPCDSTELDDRSTDDVLAALGDPRPPRDAVTPEIRQPESGTPTSGEQGQGEPSRGTHTVEAAVSGSAQSPRETAARTPSPTETSDEHSTESEDLATDPEGDGQPSSTHCPNVPPALDAWLARAAERIERGDPVDAASLRAVADRADSLARRTGR
jgi:hypothetical protein